LVMRGGAEPPRRVRFQFDAFQIAVEREIEVQSGLLTVSDDVQSGLNLIVNRSGYGIVLEFCAINIAKLIQMRAGELEPAWQRITADDGGAEGRRGHGKASIQYSVFSIQIWRHRIVV